MKKLKWMDRLRAAFKNRDEAELEEALKESTGDDADETEEEKKKREAAEKKKDDEDGKTGDALTRMADSLNALAARVGTLETRDKKAKDDGEETEEEKKKREEEEEKNKTSDSGVLLAEAQDVRARVEILSPGMPFPTFDAATGSAKTRDSLCALRRKALEAAYASPKTRDCVAPLVAGRDLLKLTCDALNSTFIGASELVRRDNNAQSKGTFDGGKTAVGMASTISAMNRRNADFWKGNN